MNINDDCCVHFTRRGMFYTYISTRKHAQSNNRQFFGDVMFICLHIADYHDTQLQTAAGEVRTYSARFLSLRNLQNALRDLASVRNRIGTGLEIGS